MAKNGKIGHIFFKRKHLKLQHEIYLLPNIVCSNFTQVLLVLLPTFRKSGLTMKVCLTSTDSGSRFQQQQQQIKIFLM